MTTSILITRVQNEIEKFDDKNIQDTIKNYIKTRQLPTISLETNISTIIGPLKEYINQYQIDKADQIDISKTDGSINYEVIAPIIAKATIKKRLTFVYAYLVLLQKFRESESRCSTVGKESGEWKNKHNVLDVQYKKKEEELAKMQEREKSLVELIKNMLNFHSEDKLIENLDSIPV